MRRPAVVSALLSLFVTLGSAVDAHAQKAGDFCSPAPFTRAKPAGGVVTITLDWKTLHDSIAAKKDLGNRMSTRNKA